ncbi:hypothetical protein [Arthrobacter sp. NEB 688]|uniref:hypothetical protein n=1 Tax=Arthrobacter sp. NEB 688 TaxID=904039 RepID=UPI001566BAF7|nr:hypothetical protein [Arthrobacter sp. NEB 688]QKE84407.1 hypothetical protein HL663_10980 [Arthrobacter sp. NEB 688]
MPESDNPYRAADLPTGWTTEAFDALPVPELIEHLRHLDHRMARHPDAYGRWWISKELSEARRSLVRRGLDQDSWIPETGRAR